MTRLILMAIIALIGYALLFCEPARAHYVPKKPEPWKTMNVNEKHRYLHQLRRHVAYVCRAGSGAPKRWHCAARRRVDTALRIVHTRIRHLRQRTTVGSSLAYWINRQIAAATIIGRESAGDPWPNCPDPFDGTGASWYDTVRCENSGNWLDSPGFYRCGLQFHPMWERRFGRLCP